MMRWSGKNIMKLLSVCVCVCARARLCVCFTMTTQRNQRCVGLASEIHYRLYDLQLLFRWLQLPSGFPDETAVTPASASVLGESRRETSQISLHCKTSLPSEESTARR